MRAIGDAAYLDVDLTAGTITQRLLPENLYRLYPGGSALATYLLLQSMPAGADPLGPDNVLVCAVSPLANVPVAGISRLTITARSPLTGAIGDSQSGGFFPAELKKAGWDAIVIRGQSPRPVYLAIVNDAAELRPAEHLWGKVTGDAQEMIHAEFDPKAEVVQVGPAGENQVRFASVISMLSRANGRTGMGAVMGAKRLKAIAVRGTHQAKVADPEAVKALASSITARMADNPEVSGLGTYGTAGAVNAQNEAGGLPTRAFRTGHFETADRISGERMHDTILKERDSCYACAVRCKRVVEAPGRVDPRYGGPEYETIATFGSYCGVDDLTAIAEANQLCNMYGLDTISCGATVAFAMEMVEKGILTPEQTGDPGLKWGSAAAMLRLVKRIALREGIGNLLAEGTARAAMRLGRGAERCVVAVKGNDLPAHMPRVKRSLALIYAVNPFGADHQSSEHDFVTAFPEDHWMRKLLNQIGCFPVMDSTELTVEKVRFAFVTQQFYAVTDTLGLCQFVWGPAWQLFGPNDLVALIKAVCGWDCSLYELMQVGERRINLMKMFNVREGFSRMQDRLPDRLFEAIPDGPSQGLKVTPAEMEAALDAYYAMAGWDPKTGVPTGGKLDALQLSWAKAMLPTI